VSYEYRARVIRVVDGDTVHLEVDLGFDVRRQDSFRLTGINAPERGTPEGVAATGHLVELLNRVGPLVVYTTKDRREKYGRYLARLVMGEVDINQAMVDDGHAVTYDGGKR
jgi:micrococcal nuclease